MAELDVAFLVDRFGIFEEPLVAGNIGGIELGYLAEQLFLVVRIIELRAVGPGEPVEGHDRHQLDIPSDVVTGQRPQFLEAIGIGDDGRARIEGETVALPVIGPPSGLVARFDDGRGDACRLQANGERKAAEACTDDAGRAAGGGGDERLGAVARGNGNGSFGVHCDLSWTSGLPLPSKARMAARTDTGGLPERMRSLSAVLEFPA